MKSQPSKRKFKHEISSSSGSSPKPNLYQSLVPEGFESCQENPFAISNPEFAYKNSSSKKIQDFLELLRQRKIPTLVSKIWIIFNGAQDSRVSMEQIERQSKGKIHPDVFPRPNQIWQWNGQFSCQICLKNYDEIFFK